MRRILGQLTTTQAPYRPVGPAASSPGIFDVSQQTATYDPAPYVVTEPITIDPDDYDRELAIDEEQFRREYEPSVEVSYERRGGGGIWWLLLAGYLLSQ
jgi:hypothetical protein